MTKSTEESHSLDNRPIRPLLIILSGPSGAGKDAVLTEMRRQGYPLKYITTTTTRPQRPHEKADVDYHFVSAERFQQMIKNNELLEWAEVYGHWYGVPKEPVRQALKEGHDVMVKVDVQGAATIKKIVPQAVAIFLTPPSVAELSARLKQRQTESPADLTVRLKTAEKEMKQLPLFDYIVINHRNEISQAASEIKAIITAEKCWVTPREIKL